MAQILIKAEPRPSWGHPKYDPIWAAATKHDITVSCHLSRSHFDELPIPPVGFPSYNHDFMVTYSLLAANQVMSLIFDGVFDRFPTLRIVFVEHAFSWILPLMWRMDAIYEARKSWMDIKRKPSEYVKDHIKFTTQPLDYPEDKTELTRALEWMECDKILLFSSDYPHWTFDDPRWLVKHLPEAARERSCSRTASRPITFRRRCRSSRARCGCSELPEEVAKRPRAPAAQGREHVVATVDEIPPGTHKLVPIGRHGVGVYNVNGTFYAIANYCPHQGGPLCSGRARGRTIVDESAPRRRGHGARSGVHLLPLAPMGFRARDRHDRGQAGVEHPHLPGTGRRQ